MGWCNKIIRLHGSEVHLATGEASVESISICYSFASTWPARVPVKLESRIAG